MDVPEGPHHAQRKAVSGRGTNLFWRQAKVPAGIGRAVNPAKIGRRQGGQNFDVRPLWREPGQGNIAGIKLDVPRRRDQQPDPQIINQSAGMVSQLKI